MKHLVENKNDLNMVLKRINLQNSNISRFEGNLYRDGNRQTGAKVLLSVLRALKKETNKPVTELLGSAVSIAFPFVVIRSKKVGGATYKIPVHLHKPKEVPLAVKTLVSNSCGRKLGLSSRNLEKELLLVLKGEGTTLYKRNALHTLAFNNRAYVKYL
jgi:small subunit ribosomal protein S7